MTQPVVLVMAKAPIPGFVKTRLALTVGPQRAAALAAAALLDTLDACESAFPAGRRYLALSGALVAAHSGDELRRRLTAWTVLPQRGEGLAARLANAHRDVHRAAGAAVVQIGMDTPHVEATVLEQVATTIATTVRPVLGLAEDGGWWLLATAGPGDVDGLERVPMSSADTGAATARLLHRRGVTHAPVLRDVDSHEDAEHVAALAPSTRFARAWHACEPLGASV